MADITVTVTIPDALVAEFSAATGATTKAEASAWFREQGKNAIKSKRLQIVSTAEEAKVQAARDASLAAEEAAQTTADTEIVLT